jgi:hypothetical protein
METTVLMVRVVVDNDHPNRTAWLAWIDPDDIWGDCVLMGGWIVTQDEPTVAAFEAVDALRAVIVKRLGGEQLRLI